MTREEQRTAAEKPSFRGENTYKTILLTVLTGGLVALAAIGIKRLLPSSTDIKANIWPRVFSVKDSLHYRDSSGFATQVRWAFGDGNQSFLPNGAYRFSRPGNYIVQLTVNGKFIDTFFISIADTARTVALRDSIATIDAPSVGMQLENLVFRATAVGAAQFRWKFGESGGIDSKEAFAQYFYKQPGDYTVLLYTDNSQYPTRHNIKILPSYQAAEDSMGIDDIYKKYEDDFKAHLQQIANGGPFNTHYYYLLKKYLCNNEKTVMKINGSKVNDFNAYCLGLQFDEGETILSVKLTADESLNCIKAVEVRQVRAR